MPRAWLPSYQLISLFSSMSCFQLNLQGWRLILASKSPRRAELLRQVGLTFDVRPSSFEEDLPKSLKPIQYVESTAVAKGQEVFTAGLSDDERTNCIVLAADTIVEGCPGEIWEKPRYVSC